MHDFYARHYFDSHGNVQNSILEPRWTGRLHFLELGGNYMINYYTLTVGIEFILFLDHLAFPVPLRHGRRHLQLHVHDVLQSR